MTGDTLLIVTLVIFAFTYLVLAIGRLPFYHIDRAGAALLGASLMVAVGTLGLKEAYAAIDLDTITLLLGMMIVVANLKLSGFFQLTSAWVAGRAGHPLVLLVGVTLVAGFFSAFLVNDTICLAMTPLVLELALLLGPQSCALPPRGRHGLERRQHRHDHGQPAEHHDRQPVADPLWQLRRRPVPDRGRGPCF